MPRPSTAAARPAAATLAAAAPGAAADADAPLPRGWRRVESLRRHPGQCYYVSPLGEVTWTRPVVEVSTRSGAMATMEAIRKDNLHSLYQKDYLPWPTAPSGERKASPSYIVHPKAKKDANHFKSMAQVTYVDHHAKAPPPRPLWPVFQMPPFEHNSLYRSDFVPHTPQKHESVRSRTPPQRLRFNETSTQRADYVKFDVKKPPRKPQPPTVNPNAPHSLKSTYRESYTKEGANSARHHPRFFVEQGWLNGKNPAENDTFLTLYQKDFIDFQERQTVPRSVRRDSFEVDQFVVKKNSAHEDLVDFS